MSIPFTQYLRPHGRPVPVTIDMPDEIENMAETFIKRGGSFECEVLAYGNMVSLTACYPTPHGQDDIAIEVVVNGPAVPAAVERLVRKADKYQPGDDV